MHAAFVLLSALCVSAFASKCENVSCLNDGRCEIYEDDHFCKCLPGFSGIHCEIDRRVDCDKFVCWTGVCEMEDGFPKCRCPVYATGIHCDQSLVLKCLDRYDCERRAQDGVCDPRCNNPECGFDFGDCEGKEPDVVAAIFTLNSTELSRDKQKYLNTLSNGIGIELEIWKDENGEEGIYGYDPELRRTYGVESGLESNYSNFKVILAGKNNGKLDVYAAQKGVMEIAQIYHLPIPAAVVQGPMPQSSPYEFVVFAFAGVVLALMLSSGAVYRVKTPTSYLKTSSEGALSADPQFSTGVTSISTIVAAWMGLATSEQLLADMAASNDEDSVRMRIAELSSVNAQNPDGLTAIALAVDRGFVNFLNDLLGAGANPNIADNNGNTPLHRAVISGSTVMVSTLLSSGKIETVDAVNGDNDSALMLYAKLVADEQMGRTLLQHGAKVSFSGLISLRNFHKKTALHFAAQSNNLPAINLFATFALANSDKFEVNAQDVRLRTPLMITAEYGNARTCQELIRLGADKSIEDDMRKTAEAYAKEGGFVDLANFLNEVVCIPQRKRRSGNDNSRCGNKRVALQKIDPNQLNAQQNVACYPTTVSGGSYPYGTYYSPNHSCHYDYAPFAASYSSPVFPYQGGFAPPPIDTIPQAPIVQQQYAPALSPAAVQYPQVYCVPQRSSVQSQYYNSVSAV